MVRISEDFGPWTMYMCVVITFAIVTMLRDFGPSGIEFMIVCYKRHHIVRISKDFGPSGIEFMIVCYKRHHIVRISKDFGPSGIEFMIVCYKRHHIVRISKDFGPYGIILMNLCCYNLCHGNVVKGFWALWDYVRDCVF
jgi:hypothetical protein